MSKKTEPVLEEHQLMVVPEGYKALFRVLDLAMQQASQGKGKERHSETAGGNFRPWIEQPIMEIGRTYGMGYQAGQAAKKLHEAVKLPSVRAKEEVLGAIVYAAALWHMLDERQQTENLCPVCLQPEDYWCPLSPMERPPECAVQVSRKREELERQAPA